MTLKNKLETKVRGWFPQEPKIAHKSILLKIPLKNRPLSKPITNFVSIFATNMVVSSPLFIYSSVQIALIVTAALLGLFLFITNKLSHKQAKLFLKRLAIVFIAFILVFSCFQFLVFQTSGYPTTSVPKLTYSTPFNASLTQLLQELEQSENFQLLQLTHLNSVKFERLQIYAYPDRGWLTWTFRTTDTNSKVTIGGTGEKPYYTNADNLMESLFLRITYDTQYYTLQTTNEAFQQIDATGFNKYCDIALESYRVESNATSQISALIIEIAYDEVDGYNGWTIQLDARTIGQDNKGYTIYPELFEAEFKLDGTLLTYKNSN